MMNIVEFFVNGEIVATTLMEKYNASEAMDFFMYKQDWNSRLSEDDKIKVALKEEDKRLTLKRREDD